MAAVVLLAVAVDAFTFSRRYVRSFDIAEGGFTPGALAFLREHEQPLRYARARDHRFPPGEGMIHQLACLEGIQPNAPARFRDLFWRAMGMSEATQTTFYVLRGRPRWPMLRMLNLKYLVRYADRGPLPLTEGAKPLYADAQVRIDGVPDPWPRAWLVHETYVTPDWDANLSPAQARAALEDYERRTGLSLDAAGAQKATALNYLSQIDYRTVALLETPLDLEIGPAVAAEPTPRFLEYVSHRVVIETEAASPALLVLADLHYPGWTAAVDGEPVPIHRVNYLMRGVEVPAGRHEVAFRYAPRSVHVGAVASAAGLLAVVGLLGFDRARKRRKITPAEDEDAEHAHA
jgi:hypothetical protein